MKLRLTFNLNFSNIEDQYTKTTVLLYNSNKQFKNEIKKTSPFTIGSKRIKYLGVISKTEV